MSSKLVTWPYLASSPVGLYPLMIPVPSAPSHVHVHRYLGEKTFSQIDLLPHEHHPKGVYHPNQATRPLFPLPFWCLIDTSSSSLLSHYPSAHLLPLMMPSIVHLMKVFYRGGGMSGLRYVGVPSHKVIKYDSNEITWRVVKQNCLVVM
jgi:hypothetical protein